MKSIDIYSTSDVAYNPNSKVFSFSVMGRSRSQLGTLLDGRYGAMDPKHLHAAIAELRKKVKLTGVQYVLGIPEGGVMPAYEFASSCDCRLVLASHSQPTNNNYIKFIEPHSYNDRKAKYIFGLKEGDKVLIVEDEITTGRTIINCVRSLRSAGIICEDVATIYCSDDVSVHRQILAEKLRLSYVWLFNKQIINDHSE